MAGGVVLQRGQYDGQQYVPLLRNQVDDVLVVPQEERALRNLCGAGWGQRCETGILTYEGAPTLGVLAPERAEAWKSGRMAGN